MAVDLVQELVRDQINPYENFNRHNIRHLLVIIIASVPLTSILIIVFIVAVVRIKTGGVQSLILIFDFIVPIYAKLTSFI